MSEIEKIKNVIRTNIRNIKELVDNLVMTKEKLLATEEVVSELIDRVQALEAGASRSSGVIAVQAGGVRSEDGPSSKDFLELDLSESDLTQVIVQHPRWVRPFTVTAELESHELEDIRIRLVRSSAGYLRVLRLQSGTEWAYLEPMTAKRFMRMPMLREAFIGIGEVNADSEAHVCVTTPLRLQSLQRGARWEILEKGECILDD